jgi:hypothetical protein
MLSDSIRLPTSRASARATCCVTSLGMVVQRAETTKRKRALPFSAAVTAAGSPWASALRDLPAPLLGRRRGCDVFLPARLAFQLNAPQERFQRHGTELTTLAGAYGYRLRLGFAFAHDDHVGDLL